MLPNPQVSRRLALVILPLALVPSLAGAQARTGITINEENVRPESVTSSRDGAVYFGSMGKGTIYRALPGSSVAEPWITAGAAGLTNVLGVLAHDASGTLWVCQNSTGGRDGAPATGQTALRSFDLSTGAAKGTYPFPNNGGVCNDITVADDGTVYATETVPNRIVRLRRGADVPEVWFTDPQLGSADGIAQLADGALYVNGFRGNGLFRIPINADGSAGSIQRIETSLQLDRPDGLRPVGAMKLLQTEQGGRLAELIIDGTRAEMRVIKDGLSRASAVTVIGDQAVVLLDFERSVIVPYPRR